MASSAKSLSVNWIQKYSDLIFAFGLITVVIMFIIPLPTFLLDLMITTNIAFALTVLLVSIYTQEAVEISVFPSLLLFATLFRLALNVSTTRLILGQADAGQIIFAFGDFVVGGNYIVGFIIFLILVVIQFIVITKGAERVAEVAARFTLDAMPGKQMSIDADLNAGLIDENEARETRKKIRQEADFYGAMDGASKFVKGDAIAGIIITLINITGGLIVGMLQMGLSINEALQTYAILTIGDGLVSQIPALILATSTGMVVTRAASESNLGSDLAQQMTKRPKVLFVVAIILIFLGLTRGLPTVPFLLLAVLMGVMGLVMRNSLLETDKATADSQFEATEQSETAEKKAEDYQQLIKVDPVELEVGYNLIPLVLPEQGGDFLERITLIRRQLAVDLGVIIPPIRVLDNMQIEPNAYVIKLRGMDIANYQIMPNHYLAMESGEISSEVQGISTEEPAFGLPAMWIADTRQEDAEIAGYTVVDSPTIMATHLTEVLKDHAGELLGRKEVKELIESLKEDYSAVINELIPDQMSLGEIQKVLQYLLEEGVSIRDQVTILETLADWAPKSKDTVVLTEYVRAALKRQICQQHLQEGVLNVLTLEPKIEAQLNESLKQNEQGTFLNLDPQISHKLVVKINEKVNELREKGYRPVLLSNPLVRFHLYRMLRKGRHSITVLSYNEVDSSIEARSVGVVRPNEN